MFSCESGNEQKNENGLKIRYLTIRQFECRVKAAVEEPLPLWRNPYPCRRTPPPKEERPPLYKSHTPVEEPLLL